MKMIKRLIGTSLAIGLTIGLAACVNGVDPELEAATEGREPDIGFHLVADASKNPQTMRIAVEQGMTPPGLILVPYPEQMTELLIQEKTRINQDCMQSAKASLHPETNDPILNFRFDDECTRFFAKLTSENLGRRFAIVMNDEIVVAVTIRTAITGGYGFIEGGSYNIHEARELAFMINRNARKRRQKD